MIGWIPRTAAPGSDGAKFIHAFLCALVALCLAVDALVAVIAFLRGGSPPVGTILSVGGGLIFFALWTRPAARPVAPPGGIHARPVCDCRRARPVERDLTGHRYDCSNHPPAGWPHS